ncbi:MAG TPA: hypothetical protein VKT52_13175, partial [Ktedonobacterales bacterium]|nr:hypothetical protein [Ktedonobacterales bacterium]
MLAQRIPQTETPATFGGARARRDATAAIFWLLAAAAFVYLALPIVNLLVVEPWRDVPAALADPIATSALATSLAGATVSTILIAVFGVPLAYMLAHRRFRLRPLVTFLVYVPLVFPAVVSG